jgi:hypothetical protein
MIRVKIILAVVALVVAMMMFAAPAIADSEISSSGGNSIVSGDGGSGVVTSGGDVGDIDLGPDGLEVG